MYVVHYLQYLSSELQTDTRAMYGTYRGILSRSQICAVVVLPSSSQGFGFVLWTYILLEIDHKNLKTQRFSKEPKDGSIAKVRGRL